MNPAANATASGGIAGSATLILAWLASLAHLTVPSDVQSAIAILLTAGVGYALHRRSCAAPPAPHEVAVDPAPAVPANPAAPAA